MLEYASKFMELSHFASAFVADEKLKMNHFEAGLNPNIKERMYVCQYISYKDLYDIVVNVERALKEKNEYYKEQHRKKRKGDQRENFYSQGLYKRPPWNHCHNNNALGGQQTNNQLKVTYIACGKS